MVGSTAHRICKIHNNSVLVGAAKGEGDGSSENSAGKSGSEHDENASAGRAALWPPPLYAKSFKKQMEGFLN